MNPLVISLFGSLIGAALFVCGFFVGAILTKRIIKDSVPRMVAPKDDKPVELSPRSIDQIQASLKAATAPAPRPAAGTFMMAPDQRPKVERVNDQAMGELITDMDNRDPEAA